MKIEFEQFDVSTNENEWSFNKDNVLVSVNVLADGKYVDMRVKWDDNGAYVLNGEQKIYVLVEV